MYTPSSASDAVLFAQVAAVNRATDLRAGLSARLDIHDDRGDVTPRTVGIAVMTAVAVAVGITITAKIRDKEASIVLD
jgi:ABC-type anion transport system duplicated permease subunit